jgi:SAM-dependent methyltransferase
MSNGNCRFCSTPLEFSFADLGTSPLSNSYLEADQLKSMEPFYPLHTYVCEKCLLVQLEVFKSPESIFTNYAYFSSYSDSWLNHVKEYVDSIISRCSLNQQSKVIEIASNDGYLLQYFKHKDIPILGIEPAENVARSAMEKGIPTLVKFFGEETALGLAAVEGRGDLIIGNNVIAHVPDIHDFVSGLRIILKPEGVITLEFPHLLKLMQGNQFDTIYHEHFSYFSFMVIINIFKNHGLKIFDVEELHTHGGSLRVYACHQEDESKEIGARVQRLLLIERNYELDDISTYKKFAEQVKETKQSLLSFMIHAKSEKKTIVGYGAPAKGNTLLNYCGIRSDFLDYTVDRNPHKQGPTSLFTPLIKLFRQNQIIFSYCHGI